MISETNITVRYAETDQMGIVHHSNYAVWFEAGRTDFIKQLGMPYSKIEESGIMLPLIGLKCSFKGVARYEDELVVKTSILDATPVRLKFYYEVCNDDGRHTITEGETEHVWTDRGMKPVNIRKKAPQLYELIMVALNNRQK